MEKQQELQRMIDESKRIVFFGGAGVSTESHIPDFRSADGLYNEQYQYPPEQVVSHTFFVKKPELFYDFYKNKMMFLDARPNGAFEACRIGAGRETDGGYHAEHRWPASDGRKQRSAGASWKYSPELLSGVWKVLRCRLCETSGRNPAV